MSGFSEQRQKLRQALVGAGIPADSAALIANILGNSAQELFHAGPVTHDTTPRGMREVGPDERKQRFQNLDPLHADPDHRRQRVEKSEDKKQRKPEPNVTQSIVPQVSDATFRVVPGPLADVRGDGETAQVGVRHTVAGIPPGGGLPVAMLDVPGNSIVGKAARAQVGPPDGSARFEVQQNGREVVLDLQLLGRSEYDVVTGVEFVEGRGLQVSYAKIKAWDQQKKRTDLIPTVEQPVVSEIIEDKNGIYGERRRIPAFSSVGIERSFLNTYRIGRFTGGWSNTEPDNVKTVTQVFPESDLEVEVVNLTRAIADTPSEKYVLFAPRIKDKVTPAPEDPEADVPPDTALDRPHPVTEEGLRVPRPKNDVFGTPKYPPDTPPMTYYAIEIQDASECYAFGSLGGMVASDLSGFDPDRVQALVHLKTEEEVPGCLAWRSQAYDVVTGVSITPYGLEFARTRIYALEDAGAVEPIVIPLTDCPT